MSIERVLIIMKIIKLACNNYGGYYVIFDEIPKMTYEEYGLDYIGSAKDKRGNIIFSRYLKYESWAGAHAFGGRALELPMKDGSIRAIKNNWYDSGYASNHGKFIDIGAGTLEKLQKCFVFCAYNINENTFNLMLDEYYRYDRAYGYKELEKWTKLQYTWYPLIFHGKQLPYMMNKKGDIVKRESKEYEYCRANQYSVRLKKTYSYFKLKYKDAEGNLIKLEDSYLNICMSTLPYTKEEIIKNCNLDINSFT